MVCVSVVCTVLVIHIGSSARPVPRCIRWFFLDFLPSIVCLRHLERSQILNMNVQKINPLEEGEHIVLQNSDEEQCEYRNEHTRVNHNHQTPNRDSIRLQHCKCDNSDETKKRLDFLIKDIQEKKLSDSIRSDWHQVAVVVDRCLLIVFIVFSLVATLTLAASLLSGINETNMNKLKEFVNGTELIVRSGELD